MKMVFGCVAYWLRHTGSAAVACRLSRTIAHGIIVPQSETEPESPALESQFSTPPLQVSPWDNNIFKKMRKTVVLNMT